MVTYGEFLNKESQYKLIDKIDKESLRLSN